MRSLPYSIMFALCCIAIGFLLVYNPTDMTLVIVQAVGGLFVLTGLLIFISAYFSRLHGDSLMRQLFPVVGLGSMCFGAGLLLWPATFVQAFMYILGGILVLFAISQMTTMLRFLKIVPLAFSVFLFPILVGAAGVFVILRPMQSATVPFTILGIAFICHGITHFVYALHARSYYTDYVEVTDDGTSIEAISSSSEQASATE